MEFKDLVVYPVERFSIGLELTTNKYFLSFPVSNQLAAYEEYYELTAAQFELFERERAAAADFLQRCRAREMDALLMVKPGRDRGVPM